MKIGSSGYLEKVQQLTDEEQERLLSRMSGKLPNRLMKEKLSREEAMAIQMELEDEQLQEWRQKMHALKEKSSKESKKEKKAEKDKPAAGEKSTSNKLKVVPKAGKDK